MSPWLSDLLLRSQSDERLVSLARTGHDRAFATLVERYRSELLALARRLNSDGRAEDILQQAFLSAFVALRAGSEVNHVRGWLYQIVRNAATKVRAPRDLPLDDVVVASEPLEDVVQTRAKALSTVTELARLPERQRDALVAIALGGRSGADVAMTMGLSEGALRQLVHRARTTLRGAVTAVTPWPFARWAAAIGSSGGTDVTAAAGVVSAGGITAKVGTLLAAGLLATTAAVLPARHHGAGHHATHHVTGAGHFASRRGASPGATATTARVSSGAKSRTGRLTDRSRSRPASGRAANSRGSATDDRGHGTDDGRTQAAGGDIVRGIDDVSRSDSGSSSVDRDSRGGSGERSAAGSGSDRHGGGGTSGSGRATTGTDNRSSSSGESIESVATTSQSGRSGSDDGAVSSGGSTDLAVATSGDSGAGSGEGPGGGSDGGSSGSGSGSGGGTHSGSGSGSGGGGSADTMTTADH